MIGYTLCRDCFKRVADDTASNRFLLLTENLAKCDCCKQQKHLVSEYFKYGEHVVTEDGLHVLGTSKKQKLNPKYSFWGDEPLYEN